MLAAAKGQEFVAAYRAARNYPLIDQWEKSAFQGNV